MLSIVCKSNGAVFLQISPFQKIQKIGFQVGILGNSLLFLEIREYKYLDHADRAGAYPYKETANAIATLQGLWEKRLNW